MDSNSPQWEYQQQNQAPAQPQQIIINQQERKRTNHALHFILTLVSLGLWLPVWIIIAIVNN